MSYLFENPLERHQSYTISQASYLYYKFGTLPESEVPRQCMQVKECNLHPNLYLIIKFNYYEI